MTSAECLIIVYVIIGTNDIALHLRGPKFSKSDFHREMPFPERGGDGLF